MFILNIIKSHAQRKADNKRIANDARLNKEIEISNHYSGYSLGQILDLISHEEKKLARLPFFRRKAQRVFIAGLYRAHKLISARAKAAARYEEVSSIANAPVVLISNNKKAA